MKSLWLEEKGEELKKFDTINSDKECDVCIIGGGITGLTSAYYLSELGLKVIIVEKDYIGQKASGNTTGKITFQHNLIYNYLINSYDKKYAKAYLEANKEAISNIKNIIDTQKIECDFEYQSNYVYTVNQSELTDINAEVKALNELDIDAEFVTNSELPLKIAGAVKIKNQAQFNIAKYMLGLTEAILKNNAQIFCKSTAYDFDKTKDGYVTFVNDFKIKSKYIIVASHYPFKKISGFYFTKMYQSTSYVLGIDTHSKLFDGMYINPTEPIYSFRTATYKDKRLLILVGADHKTGFAPELEDTYLRLENMAKKYYPKSEVLYRWNTRDCISLDKIPYIGALSSMMPNVYVATGFNKWGITSSNVAANIIKDKILQKENKYSFVFDSLRLKPVKNRDELKNMGAQVFKSFIVNRIKIPKEEVSKIENDNGAIINVDGENIGIYKDKEGKVFAVNPTCTHLGCLLTWNNLDKTWDCPCHGSRYDFKGVNIYDPAMSNLEVYG